LLHQPGIIQHHVNAPEALHGGIDQRLDLPTICDIRRHRERLGAGVLELIGKRLDALAPPRA
jgi:hypothetical protein